MLDTTVPQSHTLDHNAGVGESWASPPLGAVLGRYALVGKLGAGAMGVVHEARDLALGRHVALKLLHPGAETSEAARKRFAREARMLAVVDHPAVIDVFDVGRSEGRTFIVMRFIRGMTLREWLRRSPPTQTVLAVFEGIADGLRAAHALGVIHCDLKPSNILIDERGAPHIADFGLARLADHPTESAGSGGSARLGGHASGTPAYMAPELHAGMDPSAASDRYSFFVTLFEALVGSRPFAPSEAQSLAKLQRRGLTSTQLRKLPRSCRSVVRAGLDPDPSRRLQALPRSLRSVTRRRLFLGATVAGVAIWGAVGSTRAGEPTCVQRVEAAAASLGLAAVDVPDPFVRATLAHGADRLGAWRTRWTEASIAACATDAVPAVRRCLQRQAAEAASLATPTTVATEIRDAGQWAQQVIALPDPESCRDGARGRIEHQRAEEFEQRLQSALDLQGRGQPAEAAATALALVADADAAGDIDVALSARIAAAHALASRRDYDAAAAQLDTVFRVAESTGRFRLAAEAGAQEVWVEAVGFERIAGARRALERTRANAARSGGNVVAYAHALGNYAAALERRHEFEAAAAQQEILLGVLAEFPDDPRLTRARLVALNQIISIAAKRGDYARVRELAPGLDQRFEDYFGPYASNTTTVRAAVAHALGRAGSYKAAIEGFAVVAERQATGPEPDRFWVGQMKMNGAEIELFRGEPEAAERLLTDACPAMAKARNAEHSNVLMCELLLSKAQTLAEHPVDLERAREQIGQLAARFPADALPMQQARVSAAYIEFGAGNVEAAREHAEGLDASPSVAADAVWIRALVTERRRGAEAATAAYRGVCEISTAAVRPELCWIALYRLREVDPAASVEEPLAQLVAAVPELREVAPRRL